MEITYEKYPNIHNFLDKNDFSITIIKNGVITFEFKTTEINTIYKEFHELQTKGDEQTDEDIADNFYMQSWDLRTNMEMKYFPKLKPILEALDSFYKNRNTELEFILFLDNGFIQEIYLGYNPLYLEMYSDKELFIKKTKKELQDFDKFLESY